MIQGGEIIVILLVALVVLGPQRLPELARKLGRWTAELRSAAQEITKGLEAEVEEFKEAAREVSEPLGDISDGINDTIDPKRYEWTGPKPTTGPTFEDAMEDLERMNRRAPIEKDAAEKDAAEEEE